MAQQGTGTPQDPIKTKLYFQKKGLVYEVGGGGGGGSSSATYIKTPVILSPVNEATGVSVLATIRVSEYENLFESDAWANRHVQIATVGEFTPESIVYDHMEMATEFQVTEPALPANTVCYVRAKDYSADGLESEWSNIVMFTTGEAITVNKPELQLFGWHESTTDFVQTVKATGSEFGVTQGQIDNHIKTDWWIEQATTRSNTHIWESIGDTTNLTSITTPEIEALQPSTKYVMCCVYYGERFGASPVAMKEFTTSDDFGKVNQPTLSVEGGPSDVYETPTLTATAFSNTRDPDTHISTDWKIVLASDAGGAAVWESTSDVANLTTITVPKDKLQTGTSYIAMVRYRGQVYGVSEWAQYQFSTVAAFSSINTPTLTVAGAPSSVLETPTLTLSAFGGDNATHKNTHFKVLLNSDNSEVWSTTVAAPAVSAKVPAKTLQANTTYKFQGWYEAVEGVTSAVAEVVATTKQTFVEIGDIGKPDSPTFGVGIPSDEVAESFIPGIQKHPDFYDETKPGYGTWVVPETLIKNTTKWAGVFKFIPKFYWMPLFNGNGGADNVKTNEELQAILPYVDVTLEQMNTVKYKHPTSGVVIAKAGAFKNEADANAHGFILPAAFIDGGKEKDGFFIAPTLTSFQVKKEAGQNIVTVQLGVDVPKDDESNPSFLNNAWKLDSSIETVENNETYADLQLEGNYADGIRIAQACNPTLQNETCFTIAALSLLSLYVGQYSTSTQDVAWFDSEGLTNFPKGNNNGGSDIDDGGYMFLGMGKFFPSGAIDCQDRTTHNGKKSGVTHVNGWCNRPVVGAEDNLLFDPTKRSILEVRPDDAKTSWFSFSKLVSKNWWGNNENTPFFVEKTGKERAMNCFLPSHAYAISYLPEFGKDTSGQIGAGGSLYFVGGGMSGKEDSGIFFRGHLDNWTLSSGNSSFRAIGYPEKNSDGTVGREAFLISDDTSPFHGVSVLLNPQTAAPYSFSGETHTFNVDISVSFPSQEVMDETDVDVQAYHIIDSDNRKLQLGEFTNGSVSSVDGAVLTRRYKTSQTVRHNTDSGNEPVGGVYIKLTRNGTTKRVVIYDPVTTPSYIHSWGELTEAPEGETATPWGGAIITAVGNNVPQLAGTRISVDVQTSPNYYYENFTTTNGHRREYNFDRIVIEYATLEQLGLAKVEIGVGRIPWLGNEVTDIYPAFTVEHTETKGNSLVLTGLTGESSTSMQGSSESGLYVKFSTVSGEVLGLIEIMSQETLDSNHLHHPL